MHYATYGIKVENGRITEAAPIARWMVGKPVEEVFDWLTKKRAVLVRL